MKTRLYFLVILLSFSLLQVTAKDVYIVDFHVDKAYNSILGNNVANEFERSLSLCKSKYRVIPRIKYQRHIKDKTFEATRRFLQEEGIDYIIYGNISRDDISNEFIIEYIFEEVNTLHIVLIETIKFKHISKLLNTNVRYKTIQTKLSSDDELCKRLNNGGPNIVDHGALPKNNEEEEEKPLADTDKDGIPDELDKEANTPMGSVVDEDGVALETPKGGDSWNSREEEMIRKMLPDLPNVPFEYGKSDISDDAFMKIDQMARLMKMYPIIIVKLEGMDTNNETLATQRAEKLKEYLVKNYRLPEKRFTIASKTDLGAQDEVVATIAFDKMDF